MGNTTSMKEAGSEDAYYTRRRGRRHKRSMSMSGHKRSGHKRSGHKHSMSMTMSGHMQTKKVHRRRGRKSRRQRGGHAPAPLTPMALA